jgi:hypothetical protein
MVNPVVANVGKASGGVGKGLFSAIFKVKLAYIFIIILFIQALIVGFSSGEGTIGVVKSLGGQFFNVTQKLQEVSLSIIEKGAVFNG